MVSGTMGSNVGIAGVAVAVVEIMNDDMSKDKSEVGMLAVAAVSWTAALMDDDVVVPR